MASYSESLIEKTHEKKIEIIETMATRYDFASIRLVGQACGINIAYFVGEKMTTFEMVESLFQVSERKGKIVQLVEQLIVPERNAAGDIRNMLGLQSKPQLVTSDNPLSSNITKKVFLSHSSNDKPFVRKLSDRLNRDGFQSWIDEMEIKVGFSISNSIESGIITSGYFVIVLTPDAISSEWVRRELDIATLREIRQKDIFILPVLLEDCEIPSMIATKKYANFKNSFEQGYSELLEALH
ncbi:toll/interleukin-1 receptor domain-containing protein [Paenibacillus sp. EKM208P]|nr:toll/interleukin-1 receptor domain-containing protein [Paenibacillus sp. EKM208P]